MIRLPFSLSALTTLIAPRTLRRLYGLAGLIVFLWILGWLVVPPVLRSQGEVLASEFLGRTVKIGQVRFLPWSLELSLHDVSVADAQGKGHLLQVQRIHVDAELQSLLRWAPVVDALEIDAPKIRITQQGPGRTDIDDILDRLAQSGASADSPNAPPAAFALYNIAVRDGAVEFDDRIVHQTHQLRDLQFSLPFVSTLSSHRQVKVAPRLAFRFNGSAFESSAQAMPFSEGLRTDAFIDLRDLDLSVFRNYLPASLPVRLESALADAQLRVSFEQKTAPAVQLSGTLRVRDLKLTDADQQIPLSFDALEVQLSDSQPLLRQLRIASVRLDAPRVDMRRDAAGRFNVDWTAPSTPEVKRPRRAAAARQAASAPAAAAGWDVSVDHVVVNGGRVNWQDASVPTGARVALHELVLDASDFTFPFKRPVRFAASVRVAGQSATLPEGRLALSGEGTDRSGRVALSARALALGMAAPYLSQWVTPRVAGGLDADVGLAWNGPAIVVHVAQLGLDQVVLACNAATGCPEAMPASIAMQGRQSLAELKGFRLENAQIDLARRTVRVGQLSLAQPRAWVERAEDGRWMFERWQVAQPGDGPGQTKADAAPWSVHFAEVGIDGGAAAFRDSAYGEPAAVNVTGLRVRMQDFSVQHTGAKPATLQLTARMGAGRADPGRLEYEGSLALAPLLVQGRVLATQLPLHALEPYVSRGFRADIRRADGSFKGQVQVAEAAAGLQWRVQGDAALDDVRIRMPAVATTTAGAETPAPGSLRRGEDLLNWKSLGLRGVDAQQSPGKPVTLEVRETSLSDFFARIILQPDGRLNLQGLVQPAVAAGSVPVAGVAVQPAVTGSAKAMVAADATLKPVIRLGPMSLTGGRIHFTDLFVRPNYSANLTELAGRLGATSSEPAQAGAEPAMAELELRGRAEGTASLEIVGTLNPLAQPLALDVQGRMRDLELPPLSPYTIKYAGHGIERGKLSMDVRYRVQPDGQLTASNQLVLHQLTFGDPIEGAPASLPVRLAVALLADRNGVIDVELPISGSLNDPEFRLGSLIFKIIGNLVMKAVTAPFSLLTGALGGGNELGQVSFAAGSVVLDDAARQDLDKVVKALSDRPALKLTVAGMASLEEERDAWKRQTLLQALVAQKRRAAMRAGQPAQEVKDVTDAEYPTLLQEVYRRSDITKPRNLVGIAKDLPVQEMEALLLAGIPVSEEAMRELALARGVAVRDYLASRQLAPERLFLGAAKVLRQQVAWKPRAELSLATR